MNGPLAVLLRKGRQEAYRQPKNDPDHQMTFDARTQLLSDPYQVVYGSLATEVVTIGPLTQKHFVLGQCDYVNMIDPVVTNPEGLGINDYLERVDVRLGDMRMDAVGGDGVKDVDTQIRTSCALFKRPLSHINGRTFIPLNVAPLHQHNLVRVRKVYSRGLEVRIELRRPMEVQLYANKYVASKYPEMTKAITTITAQHYSSAAKMTKGVNTLRVSFDHPCYLMYFWGFDKSKVKNVTLRLDKRDDVYFYKGPLDALEHYKYTRMGHDVDPVVIYFSDKDVFQPTMSSFNFSLTDYVDLIIDTDQEEETDVYIVGLSMHPLTFRDGCYGMRFYT